MTLWSLKVTFCSLCSHYNKISLADKKFPSCTNTMTLLIKTKGQKSLLPSGMWSWDENQGILPNEYSVPSFLYPT